MYIIKGPCLGPILFRAYIATNSRYIIPCVYCYKFACILFHVCIAKNPCVYYSVRVLLKISVYIIPRVYC